MEKSVDFLPPQTDKRFRTLGKGGSFSPKLSEALGCFCWFGLCSGCLSGTSFHVNLQGARNFISLNRMSQKNTPVADHCYGQFLNRQPLRIIWWKVMCWEMLKVCGPGVWFMGCNFFVPCYSGAKMISWHCYMLFLHRISGTAHQVPDSHLMP